MWRIDPESCAASFLLGLVGAAAYVLLMRLAG